MHACCRPTLVLYIDIILCSTSMVVCVRACACSEHTERTCAYLTVRHRKSPPWKRKVMSQASWGRTLQNATIRSAMLRCMMNRCMRLVFFWRYRRANSTQPLPKTARTRITACTEISMLAKWTSRTGPELLVAFASGMSYSGVVCALMVSFVKTVSSISSDREFGCGFHRHV